jgi:phosphatidylglycerol:prolipoprotein diacylglycerol transferase
VYPRISDLFVDWFGVEFPVPIYSFGLMVAVAILVGAWLAARELDRMYGAGQIGGVRVDAEGRRGTTEASPSVLVGFLAVIAGITGIVGAKIFHILENLNDFFLDPSAMIFSTAGLTFYGGLIVAGLVIAVYLRRRDLSTTRFADAVAPGLMLAYGIGRIGCYLAGDGDWGVCSDLAEKPDWIPAFLWSETFPRSILDAGNTMTQDALRIENCGPAADGVYPTMLYETAMAVVITGILWAARKHPFQGGWLFSLYLVFNGVERFLIEQIRVNNTAVVLGVEVTQAEVIAVLTVLLGIAGLAFTSTRVAAGTSTE